MEPNKPTKAIRKDQVWSNRSIHLRSHIDSLGLKKTQKLDAHALVKVFFFRRSLRLKLSDTYLAKVWQMSLRNVQHRLRQLEQAGLIKRLTGKAKRTADGFRQDRRIVLLVSKKSQQLNLQAKPAVDNSTQRVKQSRKCRMLIIFRFKPRSQKVHLRSSCGKTTPIPRQWATC